MRNTASVLDTGVLRRMRIARDAMDPDSAEHMKALIAKGVLGAGAFNTDDCQAEYERLSAAGVEFVQKPERRPYGIEAVFRDDSGCWYSLTEPFSELDETAPWNSCAT